MNRPSPGPSRPRPRPQPGPAPAAPAEPRPTRISRRQRERGRRRIVRRLVIGLAALCVLGAAGGYAWMRANDSTPPAHRDSSGPTAAAATGANLAQPVAATAFLAGAASDIAAVTTYDYRSLDDALNAGLSVTTGEYRTAYRQALTGSLAEAARRAHAVHTFETLKLGIGEMTGDTAKVLIFGLQTVTDDTTGPTGSTSPVTLCATILHTGDQYLIAQLVAGANAGLPPGGPQLPIAAQAARTELVNTLSYRRTEFDTDLQRALAGATGALRKQLQTQAAQTKSAMAKGMYDLTGAVTAMAVAGAETSSVTFLMAADADRLVDGAPSPSVTSMRYVVTMTRTPTGWLASSVTSADANQ